MTITTSYPATTTANKALAFWYEKGPYNSAATALVEFVELPPMAYNPTYGGTYTGTMGATSGLTNDVDVSEIQTDFNSIKTTLMAQNSVILTAKQPVITNVDSCLINANGGTNGINYRYFNLVKICGKLEANKTYIFENIPWFATGVGTGSPGKRDWFIVAVNSSDTIVDITPANTNQAGSFYNQTISFDLVTTEEIKAVLLVPVGYNTAAANSGYGVSVFLMAGIKVWEKLT